MRRWVLCLVVLSICWLTFDRLVACLLAPHAPSACDGIDPVEDS